MEAYFRLFSIHGLIAYLISFTFMATGYNILKTKDFFLIIENIFYATLYIIFGSLFLSHYYPDAFTLYINGNGGFVGSYFNQTFLKSLINFNEIIVYYLLIALILVLFLLSINFSSSNFLKFFKRIF